MEGEMSEVKGQSRWSPTGVSPSCSEVSGAGREFGTAHQGQPWAGFTDPGDN